MTRSFTHRDVGKKAGSSDNFETAPRNSRVSRIKSRVIRTHKSNVESHVTIRQICRVVTICIFRDGNSVLLFAVAFSRRHYRSFFPVSELPDAFDFFFPPIPSLQNGLSTRTSLVAVTVCKGFSIGWLYPARSHGPSTLSGTCL